MTEKELKRVLKVWCKRLKLEHWQFRFNLGEDPPGSGDEADISMCENYDAATIRLRSGWEDWDVDTLNEVIAHELVHCLLKDFQYAALIGRGGFTADAADMYAHRITHEVEHTTDTITMIMLKSFGNA